MGQVIKSGKAAIKIFKGATAISKIYKGAALIWTRARAGKPVISSFTASAPANGFVTLRFRTSKSTRNRITRNGVNVPLTTSTTAAIADPGVGSYDYVLTSSNAAGKTKRTVTVTKNAAPTLRNFRVAYQSPQGPGRFTNGHFNADWSGWPRPAFTIDYGNGVWSPVSSGHIRGGATSGTIHEIVHTYSPGQNLTARLRAVNSEGTVTVSVEVAT